MDTLEHTLLHETAQALTNQGVPTVVEAEQTRDEKGHRSDGVLRVRCGGDETVRTVELKRYLTPATLGAVHAQLHRRPDQPLLVTEYVTPPLAERLRALGIQFADTAGNAYLQTPKSLIWLKGHPKRQRRIQGQPTGRAFEPSGLKVVFALLCDPQRAAHPYREIAQHTGVAHGTVGWVMADLTARGFLAKLNAPLQPRRLVQADRLLTQWAEAYARILRPKLLLARYRTEEPAKYVDTEWKREHMLIGGEMAAARMTRYLKPATLTFYVEQIDAEFVLANRLVADTRGNVELLEKFWNFPTLGDQQGLAPAPLVYADLLAIGDARTIEVAQILYEQIIDRLKQ